MNFSDSRDFNAGTFLWAGFDHGSGSSGGSGLIADWAGVKKPMSYWFRAWWLSNISIADSGRPVLWPGADQSGLTVYIVDSWVAPPPGSSVRSIHVYTNAPVVRLWRNGQVVRNATIPFFGFANFSGVEFEPGNLTAEALDVSGNRLGTHTVQTGGSAATIRLSLDAPSPHTGTGSAMVADGQDVALVRAELLDVNGTGPPLDINHTFYVSIYGVAATCFMLFLLIESAMFMFGGIRSSRSLHYRCLNTLMHAPVSWFDSTPKGRIISRFSADLSIVDLFLPRYLDWTTQFLMTVVVLCVVVALVLPWMVPVLLFSLCVFVLQLAMACRITRDAKRDANNAMSPVQSILAEIQQGKSSQHACTPDYPILPIYKAILL